MKALKITLIFVLILCLLAGCAGNPNPPVDSNPGSTAAMPPPTPEPTPEPTTEPTQEPEVDYVLPGYDENFFELVCEDMDYVLHVGHGEHGVSLYFISAQRVRNGDVQITTNLGKTYEPKVAGEMQLKELSMPVFLSYQGFDWKSHAQLELEDPAAADKKENQYYLSYVDARKVLRKKPLYFGKLYFGISDLLPAEYLDGNGSVDLPGGAELEIQEITVTVKGQSKTYHPKRFCITKKPLKPGGQSGFRIPGMMSSVEDMEPSADGLITDVRLDYEIREDVTLTGFVFPECPDAQVASCELRISLPNGERYEMDWDGKTPLELTAGTDISGELDFTMPQWAGKLWGGGAMYFSLAYEIDGKTGYEPYILVYTLFSDAYEYYAQKYDGIDMAAYYRDYVAVIEAAKKEAE